MGLGQKLEDARNRKGISIREATESTKIRSDYLSSFESGDFDINLPEVYLRGFVRLYSRFLGIDQEAVMSELNVELGSANAKIQKKSLGSIASKDLAEKNTSQPTSPTAKKHTNFSNVKVFYSVVGLILLIIIIITVSIFLNEDVNKSSIEPFQVVEEKPTITSLEPEMQFNFKKLSLAAIGPIERLIICDEGETPKKYHEFKSLTAGWEQSINFKTSFKCYSSSLENLRFAVDDGPEKKGEGSGAGNFSWTE